MTTTTRTTLTAALAALTTFSLIATAAQAARPKTVLISPGHGGCHQPLPRFGFSGRTIYGLGEEVVHVRWNGIAANMGLEPGDLILSLNNHNLTYRGAWRVALRDAMNFQGGHVQLRIRCVRSGAIAYREVNLGGGVGPIQPRSGVVHNYSVPRTGPISPKSVQQFSAPKNNNNFKFNQGPNQPNQFQNFQQQQISNGIKNFAKMFKKD